MTCFLRPCNLAILMHTTFVSFCLVAFVVVRVFRVVEDVDCCHRVFGIVEKRKDIPTRTTEAEECSCDGTDYS